MTAGLGAGLGTAGLIASAKLDPNMNDHLKEISGKLTGSSKLNSILKEIDSLDYSAQTKILAKDTVRDMYNYYKNTSPSRLNEYLERVDNNLDSLPGHEKTTFWGKEIDNMGALDAALR